ncbi:MAG TPA: hypothetical protein DCP08_00495 [Chloroflexi bacterium]|nr:hypothetical protein [Chloroflexota bacterium]
MEFKGSRDLPISPTIVQQMAMGSIRSVVDALVELVTNSDDSYRRLEEEGSETRGEIHLSVYRLKRGRCKELKVWDFAQGMTRDGLEKALEFAGETSGFEKGRSVRGLFGRGLKEAIISLGEGEIYTIQGDKLSATRIWWDAHKRKAQYSPILEMPATDSQRKEIGIETGSGTLVRIKVTNEKISVPDRKTLKPQIEDHYALRDINSSPRREIWMHFDSYKRDYYESPIRYEYPPAELVLDKELRLPGYKDTINVKIYESDKPFRSPRNNPFAQAGLLIKTEGAILDNQLFRYQNDPAAFYFYGEVLCKGLADRIREGDWGIIDPNRAGLEWRHDFCQTLQTTLEKALEPLVQRKKKELEKGPQKETPASTKKMLISLCNLLNRLANNELEELEVPVEPSDIYDLIIKPELANIEIDKPRTLSVYAPDDLVDSVKTSRVHVESDNPNVQILTRQVGLAPHPRYPNLYYGPFGVVGRVLGEEACLCARLAENEALAIVKVGPQKKKRKGKQLSARKGGFIRDIVPDEEDNPSQRVVYERGTAVIKIFVNFPVVARYLGPGLDGAETESGRTMLAELVGEAFCREVAWKRIVSGNPTPIRDHEIDTFNSVVNELQQKYLHRIHDVILRWKLR